jgi:hypothetical protein
MTNMPWFRFYSEAIGDAKINKIARACGMSKAETLGAWTILLCAANDSPERGTLLVTFQERYTVADVMELLCFSDSKTKRFILALIKMEMLECKKGVFRIVNWDKRQYSSDNSSERVRKYRENHPVKRVGNVSVTPPDTDTESDTDTELNKKNGSDLSKRSAWIANLLHVAEFTGGTENWYGGLKLLSEMKATDQDIEHAYLSLKSNKSKQYTIIGPQSLVTATANVMQSRDAKKAPDTPRQITREELLRTNQI